MWTISLTVCHECFLFVFFTYNVTEYHLHPLGAFITRILRGRKKNVSHIMNEKHNHWSVCMHVSWSRESEQVSQNGKTENSPNQYYEYSGFSSCVSHTHTHTHIHAHTQIHTRIVQVLVSQTPAKDNQQTERQI